MQNRNVDEILNVFDEDTGNIISLLDPSDAAEVSKGVEVFRKLFSTYTREKGKAIDWAKVKPIFAKDFYDYEGLPSVDDQRARQLLSQIVVVRLNGGLGTSMGCEGPKSALVVRDDHTFLDMTIQQILHLNERYQCNIPLVLMNSFYTDWETNKNMKKYSNSSVNIYTFSQHRCPRVGRHSLRPFSDKGPPMSSYKWFPPGHGDFYESFHSSGLLEKFIKEGKRYVFVSNIDNLGATVEPSIVQFIAEKNLNFLVELTAKTLADVKGGTLVEYDGRTRLLELNQVPSEHRKTFINVNKFPFFNTNNLWINLETISQLIGDSKLRADIIVNPKVIHNDIEVIQLETAIAAYVECFSRSGGLIVPRKRFLPVKKSQDLFLVTSNLYDVSHGTLTMSPSRLFQTIPVVKLGPEFDKVSNFWSRFKNIPDILDLSHLTVSGNVCFGSNVVLKGTVIIIADNGSSIEVPNNSFLENQIITGSLRILEH